MRINQDDQQFSSKEFEDDQERWTFELHEGNPINYNEPKYNAINTMKYTIKNFFPKILFDFFRRWQNLYILLISIILTLISFIKPETKIYKSWIFDIPLAIALIFFAIKEMYLDFIKWKKDKLINNQTTWKVLSQQDKLEAVKWKDLDIGSIVYLKKSELCPADIILLDSSEVQEKEAFCMIDTAFFDGITAPQRKKASSLTQLPLRSFQKHIIQKYKSILTGSIEYSGPCLSPNSFKGFIKLKNNPKVEQLSIENFIPRGAIILNCEWIYGLVVYTGNDTKICLNSHYEKTKRSFLLSMSHMFFIAIWIAMIICAAFIEIMFIPSSNSSEKTSKDIFVDIFAPFILLTPLLPLELFLLMDIIWLWAKFKNEKEYLEKSFPNDYFHITDPDVLSDFAHVEYALLDKTGTLTEVNPIIHSIFFNGKFYCLENMSQKNKIKSKSGFFSLNKLNEAEKESTPLLNHVGSPVVLNIMDIEPEMDLPSIKSFSLLEKNLQNLSNLSNYFKFIDNIEDEVKKSNLQNSNVLNNQEIPKEKPLVASTLLLNSEIEKSANNSVFNPEQNNLKISVNLNSHSELQSPERSFAQKILLYNPSSKNIEEEYTKINEVFNEEAFQQDLSSNRDKYFEMFEKLVLCHYSFAKKNNDHNEWEYLSKNREIEALLRFCENWGLKFEKANKKEDPTEYSINFNGGLNRLKYKIMGIFDFSVTRKKFSILYKDPKTQKNFVVVKGFESALQAKLQMDSSDEEKFKAIIKTFTNQGVIPMIYGYKTINDSEAKDYENKIKNLKCSLISQIDQLNELAEEMESNLQLLCVVGFKDSLKPEAKELVDFLQSVNIKQWIVTGDIKEKALAASIHLGIINSENEAMVIESLKKEDLVSEIRNILSILKACARPVNKDREEKGEKPKEKRKKQRDLIKNYSTEKHFLLINGNSLNIIEKDPYLWPHLAFICYLVKNVIGFNLSPMNKRVLAKIIKHRFPRKPILMAIGDGYNDILMLQTADVGVEVINKGVEGNFEPIIMAGDIKISNLRQIKEIMAKDSLVHSEILTDVIYYTGHKAILLGFPIFLYNFYSDFTSSPFQDSILVFLYSFYFVLPLQIVYALFFDRFDKKILEKIPELYIHGLFIKRKRQQKKLILGVLLEGITSAVLIFYFSIYVVDSSVSMSGWTNDLNLQALTCFYGCLIVQCARILFKLLRQLPKIKGICLFLVLFILQILFLIVEKFQDLTGKFVAFNTLQIFEQFAIIMGLVFIVCIVFFLEILMRFFFFDKWFPSPYDQVVGYLERGVSVDFNKIKFYLKERIKKKIKFSSLLKTIFKKPDWIDVLIQQMLSPDDIDAHGMKLRPWNLKITDSRLERKYIFTRKKKAIRFARGYFLLLMLTFGVYVLFDLIFRPISIYSYLKIVVLIAGFVIFALMYTKIFNLMYYKLVIFAYITAIILKILFDWFILEYNLGLSGALLALISTCGVNLNINILFVIVMNSIYLLNFIIRVIVLVTQGDYLSFTSQNVDFSSVKIINYEDLQLIKFNISFSLILLMLLITWISVYLNYKLEKQKRNEFLTAARIDLDSNKVKDILAILVPKFVKMNMIQGKMDLAEEFNDISILFCDIYNFDKIIASEKEKVVIILDNIYRFYDSLCLTYGIQKIETVGKTYMAASGIKLCEIGLPQSLLQQNKTSRIINMAFDMMKFIETVTYNKSDKVLVKIGIHTGKVIAGVIGYHKPQFSLIGDTVNTTSRVCSTGDHSVVTLSEEAMNEARSCDLVFKKKIVSAKGKGDLTTYQVKKRGANERNLQSAVKSLMSSINEGNSKSPIKSPSKKSIFGGFTNFMAGNDKTNNNNQIEVLSKVASMFKEIGNNNISNNDGNLKNSHEEPTFKHHEASSKRLDTKKQLENEDEDEDEDYEADSSQFKTLRPSKYLLIVAKTQQYEEFFEKLSREYTKIDRIRILVMALMYLLRTLLLISLKSYYENIALVFFFRGLFVACGFLSVYLVKKIGYLSLKSQTKRVFILIFLMIGSIASLLEVQNSMIPEDFPMSFLEILFNYLVHSNLYFVTFVEVIIQSGLILWLWLIICGLKDALTLEYVALFIAFMVFNLVKIHGKIYKNMKTFNQIRINEAQRVEQESLVSQLLPLHAFEKLKEVGYNNKVELTDVFTEVTILFADIAGFTKYSASVKPQQVVIMLKNLFTEFDKMCVKHKVYKVYTIGDCYVVLGFLHANDRSPVQEAKNVVNMGLSMIEIIRNVRNIINFQDLDMRIGIHTGNIIGGIIGTDIVRYDIYGNDVLIANKMESNGVTGNIMVSESTKKLLEEENLLGYRFEKKKDVECKGLDKPIAAYLIHVEEKEEEESKENKEN